MSNVDPCDAHDDGYDYPEKEGGSDAARPIRHLEMDWDGMATRFSRFNFIDPTIAPPDGSGRRAYMEAVATGLIPDGQGPDETLTGARILLRALLEAVSALADSEAKGWLPAGWTDMPPSLPMVAAWMQGAVVDRIAAGPAQRDTATVARIALGELAHTLKTWRLHERIDPLAWDSLTLTAASPALDPIIRRTATALSRFRDPALRRNASTSDFSHEDFLRPDGDGDRAGLKVTVADRDGATVDLTRLMHKLIEMRLRATEGGRHPLVITNGFRDETNDRLAPLRT